MNQATRKALALSLIHGAAAFGGSEDWIGTSQDTFGSVHPKVLAEASTAGSPTTQHFMANGEGSPASGGSMHRFIVHNSADALFRCFGPTSSGVWL